VFLAHGFLVLSHAAGCATTLPACFLLVIALVLLVGFWFSELVTG